MSPEALRKLVLQYASGEVDLAYFRRLFVSDFLSRRHYDGLEGLANSIESACADWSEGLIDEAALRAQVARVALPTQLIVPSEVSYTVNEVFQRTGDVMLLNAMNLSERMDSGEFDSSNAANTKLEAVA